MMVWWMPSCSHKRLPYQLCRSVRWWCSQRVVIWGHTARPSPMQDTKSVSGVLASGLRPHQPRDGRHRAAENMWPKPCPAHQSWTFAGRICAREGQKASRHWRHSAIWRHGALQLNSAQQAVTPCTWAATHCCNSIPQTNKGEVSCTAVLLYLWQPTLRHRQPAHQRSAGGAPPHNAAQGWAARCVRCGSAAAVHCCRGHRTATA